MQMGLRGRGEGGAGGEEECNVEIKFVSFPNPFPSLSFYTVVFHICMIRSSDHINRRVGEAGGGGDMGQRRNGIWNIS